MSSGEKWSKEASRYSLANSRICYELSGRVIPDAWLLFEEKTAEGVYEQPLIFGMDRGMEYQQKFKNHVRNGWNLSEVGNTPNCSKQRG